MNKDKAQALVNNWLSILGENDPVLFETEDDGQTVKIKQHKRYGLMVGRSEELTEQLKKIRSMVQAGMKMLGIQVQDDVRSRGFPTLSIRGIPRKAQVKNPSFLCMWASPGRLAKRKN